MEQMLYMRLEGIDGEEPIGASQEMIAINSYSHGLSMPVAPTRPSVGEDAAFRTSYCRHGAFTVVKGFDKSSTKLFEACANGVKFPNVGIHVCTQEFNSIKNTSEPAPMLSINLTDAIMVDFSYSFQGGWQVENIAFQYTSIGWKVKWVDPEKGDSTNLEPVGWDGQKNSPSTISIPSSIDWSSGGLL